MVLAEYHPRTSAKMEGNRPATASGGRSSISREGNDYVEDDGDSPRRKAPSPHGRTVDQDDLVERRRKG